MMIALLAFAVMAVIGFFLRKRAAAQQPQMAGAGAPVTIDGIMQPAVARSVQQGLLWAAVVFAAGVAGVAALRARDRRAAGDPRE